RDLKTLQWTEQDFPETGEERLPMGPPGDEWKFGDLETGFRQAEVVLDGTFGSQSTSHQRLDARTAMAYWQQGKVFLHVSTQSVVRTVPTVAGWTGIDPANIVLICEYTGGGFGSKIPGAQSMAIPALLAKKAGRPVMMRISREEEYYIGRARTG